MELHIGNRATFLYMGTTFARLEIKSGPSWEQPLRAGPSAPIFHSPTLFMDDKVPLMVWSLIFAHQMLPIWQVVILTSSNLSHSLTRQCSHFMKLSLVNLFSAIMIVPSSDKSSSLKLIDALYSRHAWWLLLRKFSILSHHLGCGLGAQ